ncbi:MAG TPA: DUF2231 domain-containing protein [Gemmatimonadaceae bacterium]
MLPNPLHPAVVHFPVVLAFLLPLFVAAGFWALRRGVVPRRAWLLPTVVAAALAVSAWASVETGEAEDERVERVVSESAIEAHEELAETFLATSAVIALISAAGLLGGVTGRFARFATLAGSLALVVVVTRVGHTGGQLVYKYGAASAYTGSGPVAGDSSRAGVVASERRGERAHDDDR